MKNVFLLAQSVFSEVRLGRVKEDKGQRSDKRLALNLESTLSNNKDVSNGMSPAQNLKNSAILFSSIFNN